MIFRQFMERDTSTFTYLLGDEWSREAILIDPVRDMVDRDVTLLEELGLQLVYALDTHVHADHITGSGTLRARTGCQVVVSEAAVTDCADIEVGDGNAIRFGLQALEVRATPGHTAGCVSYVTADRSRVFTGDALLVRGCGRTDFQEGDARTLFRSVRDKLFSLPDETLIYPAHDYNGRTVSSVREEKLYNPRLNKDRTEDEFVEIMANLNLPYPRRMEASVPANRRCGLIEGEQPTWPSPPDREQWPVFRTPTGAPNVPAIWVANHLDDLAIVDVRAPGEWTGPLGRIRGAILAPMDDVLAAAESWDRHSRTVLVCRSGGRTDHVAMELENRGFDKVASMTGGMLQWVSLGLPVAEGKQG